MKGFAIWQGVMAACTTVVAGSTLSGVVGPKVAGFAGLLVASAQAGTAAYTATLRKHRARRPRAERHADVGASARSAQRVE
jgi:hypothetical protein